MESAANMIHSIIKHANIAAAAVATTNTSSSSTTQNTTATPSISSTSNTLSKTPSLAKNSSLPSLSLSSTPMNLASTFPTTIIDLNKLVLEIQKNLIGKLIGKGGETILSLHKKSGAQILIDQQVSPCKVTITGSPSSIQLAKSLIHELYFGVPSISTHSTLSTSYSSPIAALSTTSSPYTSTFIPQNPSTPLSNTLAYAYQSQTTQTIPLAFSPVQFPYSVTPYQSPLQYPSDLSQSSAKWVEAFTSTGQSYWYNTITRAVQWEKPK